MTIIYNDERHQVPVLTNFLDDLEEALYVLYELTPSNRCWKAEAIFNKLFFADYHDLEFVSVELEGDTIIIKDCN